MVFSSPEFVFLFLPITVLLYYLLLRLRQAKYIALFIFCASLFYYAYWRPQNIWIICASIVVNYFLGKKINAARRGRKLFFILGVSINLGALGWYKYTDFILTTLNQTLHTQLPLQNILLPIGISFFTFQQIGYLADIYLKKFDCTQEDFFSYCCFVCFFPQLVAGPIVHHREMMPQFFDAKNHSVNWENIYHGLVLLSIGLAKKVLVADNLSPIVHHCFDVAESLSLAEALFGSIAYTLQLYFDFSAYSDMAIACALFFNIHLPWNFNSPYKARSIQDFWRRWHITLSRWLRDYLYIPFGGNRKGFARMLVNLFLTFLLGGLWHGAAWTFVLWGGGHGIALIVQRLWAKWGKCRLPAGLDWMLTFAFVNAAWILFRASSFGRAWLFVEGFCGRHGSAFTASFQKAVADATLFGSFSTALVFTIAMFTLAITWRNSSMIYKGNPKFTLPLAVILSVMAFVLILLPDQHSEFIYSQF